MNIGSVDLEGKTVVGALTVRVNLRGMRAAMWRMRLGVWFIGMGIRITGMRGGVDVGDANEPRIAPAPGRCLTQTPKASPVTSQKPLPAPKP